MSQSIALKEVGSKTVHYHDSWYFILIGTFDITIDVKPMFLLQWHRRVI